MTSLPAFVGTTFLLALLPGVGQAVMTRQILTNGRRPALMSTLGTGVGLILWSLAAAAGLSAVVLANPGALTVLRYGGGLFLMALGIRTLLRRPSDPALAQLPASHAPSSVGSFLTGLATNLSNPKAGIFAVVLLPQFIPAGADQLWTTSRLGLIWATVTMAWYVLYTWLIDRGQQLLATPRARAGLAIASGVALISVGASVAAGL
jgi:threonine/homoserine/homoserine lactone efflux protein